VLQGETGVDFRNPTAHVIDGLAQDAFGLLISPGVCQHIAPNTSAPRAAYGRERHKPQRLIVPALTDQVIGVGCEGEPNRPYKKRQQNEPERSQTVWELLDTDWGRQHQKPG
jgi:hypothetical protein